MRCRIRRRSVSSFVSPGPSVPMPPPGRDSASLDPTRRGIMYLSWASSTWSLPSRVRARRAKMSRMSCVRSTTFRSSAPSRFRSCGGEHLALALPEKRRGIRLRALLLYAQYGIGARGRREPRQLVERMFGVEVPGRVLEETDERGAFALDHGHWEMVRAVGVFRGIT